MSAKIDSSVKPEDAVTCPDCGAEFDIADRLRSHIESSIRIEMAQKYEEERENDLAIHNAEIEKQRAQINDLRKAKIDFDNLLAEQDIAIQEAKAQGAREAMKLANQGLEEKVSQRAKEITSEKDLEISRLELEATRKNEIIERLQQQSKSGELEGEVLELAVENQLRNLHPRDNIKEVKRGNYGADIEQSVLTNTGSVAGKILWECKKHKKWQNSWLNTIRKNALEFNADTMVIVTTTMPKGMETFGKIDDVFICKYSEVPVVSQLLNHAVLKAHRDNQRGEHMMSIHERVSEYISGPEFAMVMRVVIKAYEDFEDDLRKEEQYMKTRWKSRRIYLSEVIDSITSLAGKLEYLGAGHFEVMQEIGSQVPPALPEPVIIEDIEIEEVEEE